MPAADDNAKVFGEVTAPWAFSGLVKNAPEAPTEIASPSMAAEVLNRQFFPDKSRPIPSVAMTAAGLGVDLGICGNARFKERPPIDQHPTAYVQAPIGSLTALKNYPSSIWTRMMSTDTTFD